ncbi:MAG: AAA family ATPase [Treponema sp.]|nr:AAA family ATPase [Treponema sp.]
MGIYLNPRNDNFKEFLNSEIFVDKTMILSVLNGIMKGAGKYICISRPRRFGKTYAANIISSYYSKGCDSRKLFERCKISKDASFESNLNKFNVIKLDINSEYRNTANKNNLISEMTADIRDEFIEQFPDITFTEKDSIAKCILKVFDKTGEKFVILMDEYDVLVRENVEQDLFNQYLDFLNGLFKSDTLRPAIALAYLTGILPIVRDKVQSKLNNFDEYTILNAGKLSEYTGFTTEEVRGLCLKYNIDFEECRRWYDGYNLVWFEDGKKKECEIYNPESVVKTMLNHKFFNYWSKTSSYEVISDRLNQNFAGTKDDVIKMIAGEDIDVNVTTYKNTINAFTTKNDIFTYLMHLGYLSYDDSKETCRIPNKEVLKEWTNAVSVTSDYSVTDSIISSSKELLEETINCNESAVAKALDESHIHVTSNRSYNNEDALQSAIYLSYIYALNKYTIVREMTAGKGFADVAFIPFVENMPAMIIELKRNDCADSAIKQIKKKRYFDSLTSFHGNLLFVGINYDEKTKLHECRIEKLEV